MATLTNAPPPYDTLLCGATLIDGTGTNAYVADVAIKGNRIAAIGELKSARTAEELDVAGLYIAPGFIDTHTHDDQACMSDKHMEPKISQGVTTVVVGNCGVSLAPLDHPQEVPEPINLLGSPSDFRYGDFQSYFDAVDSSKPITNVVALIGHSSLRVAAMRDVDRLAQPGEINTMTQMVDEGMKSGASGLSSGVFYQIGSAADNSEIIPLIKSTAEHGGIYASHMRNEHEGVLDAMREVFEAARVGGTPLLISHHKCAGKKNWGRSKETLALFDSVRMSQDVSVDMYPYEAASSVLNPDLVGEETPILITWSTPHPRTSGRYLRDIAQEWHCGEKEAARKLSPAGACYFFMSEDDIERIIQHPSTMIGSDGLPMDEHPHPRLWGTFPRVIRRYAIQRELFSIEEAIRKMTSLPASRFGLRSRGTLKHGFCADLVVFDPSEVADTATYQEPKQVASGINMVFVNGRLSWDGKSCVNGGFGHLLRSEGRIP
ncbi:MAG: D-aminoacylase [Gammaproteobacteria bacterium]|nr:D-aminoacylase [Gammaproteobacteria bacterium]